jgi:beta-ureidopropionase / N-carbamoyl-L-amino-acid hydrolase
MSAPNSSGLKLTACPKISFTWPKDLAKGSCLTAIAQPHIQQIIKQSCEELALSYLPLPSRASHDAQEMAKFTDMGMIFVPSRSGISHTEMEYTSSEQCIQGANVLLHTLLKLDRYYWTNLA